MAFRTTVFLLASRLAVAQLTTNPVFNLPRLGPNVLASGQSSQQGHTAATQFQNPFVQQQTQQGQTAATQFQNPFAQQQTQQGQTAATQFQNPFAQQRAQQGQGFQVEPVQGFSQTLNYQSQPATTTCCTAYSAECMGCINGMTAQQFCASSPTSTVCASQGGGIGGTSQQLGPINLPFTSGSNQFQAPVQQQFQAPVQQIQTTKTWSNPFFKQPGVQQTVQGYDQLTRPMIQGYSQQQTVQQGYPQQQTVQQGYPQQQQGYPRQQTVPQGYSFGASTGTGISNIDIKQKIIRPTSTELPSKAGIKFANTDGTLRP